jgi:sigma-E factor negative regulatory protein RseC
MIEEEGVVKAIGVGECWVEIVASSGCAACHQPCSVASASSEPANRVIKTLSPNNLEVQAGDRVLVAVSERQMLSVSLVLYLVPLIALFVGAAVGLLTHRYLGYVSRDSAAIIGAVSLLLATILLIKKFGKMEAMAVKPMILRRLER